MPNTEKRGELRLVTDFAELRPGMVIHVDCHWCGGRHRMLTGDVRTSVTAFSPSGGMYSVREAFVCLPVPSCAPPMAFETVIVGRNDVDLRAVWREDDGLDQEAFEREIAVDLAKLRRNAEVDKLLAKVCR